VALSSTFAVVLLTIGLVGNYNIYFSKCGLGSSVGIATDYGLDGPGSNPNGNGIFCLSRLSLGAHPTSCTMGTGSFLGVKCGRGMLLTTHPLLVPWSWKSYTSTHPLGHTGPVRGTLYLLLR
jgi:hypothetical protein